MWKRLSQLRFNALLAGLVMFFIVSQIGGRVWNDWQTGSEINGDPVTTEAVVVNQIMAISNSSGKIEKYDITYEFVAPKAAGGSDVSSAALTKKLQEDFLNRTADGKSKSEMPAARTDGNQYFSRTQPVSSEIGKSRVNGSTVQIVYARNNPQNSMIAGTSNYPVLFTLLLAVLLLIGGYLCYLGVAPIFRAS